jgi:hypothetical protein
MPYVDPIALAPGALVTANAFNQYTVHNVKALKSWQDAPRPAHRLSVRQCYQHDRRDGAVERHYPRWRDGHARVAEISFYRLALQQHRRDAGVHIPCEVGRNNAVDERCVSANTHATSRYIWFHELFLQNANASNSQILEAMYRQPSQVAANTPTSATPQMLWNAVSVDTSIDNALVVTGQWDAASANLRAELIAADLIGPFSG